MTKWKLQKQKANVNRFHEGEKYILSRTNEEGYYEEMSFSDLYRAKTELQELNKDKE